MSPKKKKNNNNVTDHSTAREARKLIFYFTVSKLEKNKE